MLESGRFGGIAKLYTKEKLSKLESSHVCIIGIGGVGSWVAEALARSGVGEITMIDPDEICITNSNRQLHALLSEIGNPKVEVLAQRIAQINPDCKVHTVQEYFDEASADELFKTKFDYVVDGIDMFYQKTFLIDYCFKRDIPLVVCGSSGGAAFPDQVAIADLNKTKNDALLFKVRRHLRRKFEFPKGKKPWGVKAVYTNEPNVNQEDPSCKTVEDEFGPQRLSCDNGLGAVCFVTGTMGFFAASVVLNDLCDRKLVLLN